MNCLHTKSKQKLNFKLSYSLLKEIGKSLCSSSSKYNNFVFLGDHNIEPTKGDVRDF